jgi:hypothetical protein
MVFTRYYDQDLTAPANTPIAAPVSVTPALETNHLERIEVDVPDGHARLTGIRFLGGGTIIVPFSQNGWIVANNHYFAIPFDDDITAGDISVQAYNTDVFPHTFYIRFVLSNRALAAADTIVSAQVPGTVAPGADAAVAALAVTPDDLATAGDAAPAAPPPGPPAAPGAGP